MTNTRLLAWKRLIPLVLSLCLLASCGFQLRGYSNGPLWLQSVAIQIQEAAAPLGLLFKEHLQIAGVPVVSDPRRAAYILVIEKELTQQQMTSVSASTTPRQYQLTYVLIYSLLQPAAVPLITSNTVTISRSITVNNDRILGSDFESMLTYKEMQKEAVMQIINRIGRMHPPTIPRKTAG